MTTNYDLLGDSSAFSDSSSSDDDAMTSSSRKLDLSFHALEDAELDHNLLELQAGTDGCKLNKLLLYNNRLKLFSPVIASFASITVLDLSNNLLEELPDYINNLSGLTQLFLRNNLLGDDSLPKSLSGLASRLTHLNLSGNRLTAISKQILELTALRNFFIGGNRIQEVSTGIQNLKRLRVLYLGGNQLRSLPTQICRLRHLHALILCDNRLESLPDSICALAKLECLQLHHNRLTTIPYGLVHLRSLSELSLRDNPLVVRFVREMTYKPSSLLELSAKVVTVHRLHYEADGLPLSLQHYLRSSHHCVNPSCRGVYFDTKVEHIKFVDFCGKYKIPLMQYLCSSSCRADRPAVTVPPRAEEAREVEKMRRVLLG